MDTEKQKYQREAIQWLFDNEMVEDPQLINQLKLNIFRVSTTIRECEFLFFQPRRQLLIYLEMNWLGNLLSQKGLKQAIQSKLMRKVLPEAVADSVSDTVDSSGLDKLFLDNLIQDVHEVVQALLPRYSIRVVTDKETMDRSVEKVKQAFKANREKKNEAPNTDSSSDSSKS